MTIDLRVKHANTILGPRITEKATMMTENNVYVFEIASGATKKDVAEAVKIFYKIIPLKVNVVKNPSKQIFVRGKKGRTAGVKKAYVYLKAGDKIE